MSDFSNMNQLSPEFKVLIVNSQALADKARAMLKGKSYFFDLTAKMQLRDDCKAVEKIIKALSKGKAGEESYKELELAFIRLQTTMDGITRFFQE